MRLKCLLLAVAVSALQLGAARHAEAGTVCRSALTPDFALEVGREGMSVLLGDRRIYQVPTGVWDQVWARIGPFVPAFSFGCAENMVTDNDMLIAVAGPGSRNAFAFGLVRGEDGQPTGVSVLRFQPRDPIFGFSQLGPRETLWIFGRDKDLWWHVCWNKHLDGKWILGPGWRGGYAGSPCTVEEPIDPGWPTFGHIEYVQIKNPD